MTQMAETRDRATSDPAERGRVLERIKEEGVDFILLWFTDLEGHLKSFAITPSRSRTCSTTAWASTARRSPASTPSRSRTWSRSRSDYLPAHALLKGDRSKVGRMICDVVTPDGEPYEGDPRYVLRRAVERMKEMGRHVQHRAGARIFLFKSADDPSTLDEGGYFAQTTLDAATELRQETIHALESMGIPVGMRTTRWGRPSTRSTSGTRTRSTWPTTCSRTG